MNSYPSAMKSAVAEGAQVVIPKALQDRFGNRTGTTLDFVEERGRLVAVKAAAKDAVAEVYGILRLGRSTDALMRELRGEPDAIDPRPGPGLRRKRGRR